MKVDVAIIRGLMQKKNHDQISLHDVIVSRKHTFYSLKVAINYHDRWMAVTIETHNHTLDM